MLVDSGPGRESHDVATKQHSSGPHGRIGLEFLECGVADPARSADSFDSHH